MRIPRSLLLGPGSAFHLWWRGHNREHVLAGRAEKEKYLGLLRSALTRIIERASATSLPLEIYGFCLMSNHLHLAGLLTPSAASLLPLSRLFQSTHSVFGRWYNRNRKRSGKVAEERFKTRLVADDRALQTVMFYSDANPVKAGMVRHPKDYRWSSYGFYAFGRKIPGWELITLPGWYLALGKTPAARQRRYRRLVDQYLRKEKLLEGAVDDAPEGYFVGSDKFVSSRLAALRDALRKFRSKLALRSPP